MLLNDVNIVPLAKKSDESNVKKDTEKILRRVKLRTYFNDKEESSDQPQQACSDLAQTCQV